MKTNFTFEELSKIFASVAKIEAAAMKQIEIAKAYEEKGKTFDVEFEKCGYTFRNAPKELMVLFDEKTSLMDARDRSERKAYKAIKDFAALVGIGVGNFYDWDEDCVKEYINKKYYFKVERVVEHCKCLAMEATRKIG